MSIEFPFQQRGLNYLTEGGQETELMYKHGFELPEFAMFPLLDEPNAVAALREMYRAYLDTAARNGFGAVVGGLDYRASPDWAARLGTRPRRSPTCSCARSTSCAMSLRRTSGSSPP